MIKTGIGQDSHRFSEKKKPLMLGGIHFPEHNGLSGNSDADVVLHALCNAITGVTGVVILGPMTDKLCQEGIVDGSSYVKKALSYLGEREKVVHVSISIEGKNPKVVPRIEEMKKNIAELLLISPQFVGITATTGEGLTEFGKGFGIQAFVIVTVQQIEEG